MNPTVYQFLATERIAGYHREADARRLAAAVARRPDSELIARSRASRPANCEAAPA
jgi:hypothetical protein